MQRLGWKDAFSIYISNSIGWLIVALLLGLFMSYILNSLFFLLTVVLCVAAYVLARVLRGKDCFMCSCGLIVDFADAECLKCHTKVPGHPNTT